LMLAAQPAAAGTFAFLVQLAATRADRSVGLEDGPKRGNVLVVDAADLALTERAAIHLSRSVVDSCVIPAVLQPPAGPRSGAGTTSSSPRCALHGSLLLQLLQLALTPLVLAELRFDPGAEDAQRGDQGVQLVERVRPGLLRVEVELEIHALVAVGDLENHPRLEV